MPAAVRADAGTRVRVRGTGAALGTAVTAAARGTAATAATAFGAEMLRTIPQRAAAPAAARGSAAVRASASIRRITTASTRSAAAATAAATIKTGSGFHGRSFFCGNCAPAEAPRGKFKRKARRQLPFSKKYSTIKQRARGATGRRAGLRIRWATLQVQILSCAPDEEETQRCASFLFRPRSVPTYENFVSKM